jgi:hypothetical protein
MMLALVPALAFAVLLTAAVSYWLPGSAKAAFAATYFVRTDGSNATCNGLTNASAASAPNCAFLTIQFAVNTAASGDTINVAAGTYNEPQVLIEKSVNVFGAGATTTIINGGNTPIASAGLVRINLPLIDTGNVTFSGFTLTNPGLTGGSRYHIFAKALSPLSILTISNNKIMGVNSSDYGLYSDRTIGSVVFDHNEITNTAFNPILIERPVGATDVHHNTISGHASTAYFNFTYSGNDVTGKQRVADNTINGSAATAISINGASPIGGGLGKYTNVEVTNNVITQLGTNRLGISLTNGASTGNGPAGAIENPVISGNSITGTDLTGSKGIRFLGLITNATIKSNNVRDVDRAFSGEVNNGHSATGTQAHFNNFVSNPNGFVWDGTGAVNAENNWWGCNFGPGTGGTGCSGTSNGIGGTGAANVDANPWLILSLMAMPTTVPAGGNSALTAKLTINSDGVDTAPSLMYVPDGTPVSFGATLGTVAPPNATTTNGTANSTFTAGMTPGMGSASSTVDGQTVSQTITISCATITLNPPSLPGGTAGTFYSQNVVASPAGTYTYAVTAGALPPGLTLDTNTGALTGTPTLMGAFSFTLTATLTASPTCTGSQAYTIVIACPAITLAPASLPNAQVNTPYGQTLTASPAGGNYTFAVTSGQLPPGLTLNSNGIFSGAATQTGTYNFGVTATGFGGCTGFRDYQLTVDCSVVTVNPASLPGGTVGTPYSQTVTASPAGTYNYTVTGGALPTGLTLNNSTGAVTGTPTTIGSFNFTITATAGGCTGSRNYTVAIGCAAISFTTTSPLPTGMTGVAYSQTINVTPAGSYTFSLVTGNLPSGLTLNSSTGVISGMPLVNGTYNFTVKAQSSADCNATQAYTLVIVCPTVTVSPATLPNGTVGTAYSQTITASPAGGNYAYSVSGTLPPGLNLNSATGVLNGTPTANGSFTFTITATGFGGCTGNRSYTLVIGGGGCPTIALPDIAATGTIGSPYNQSVAASPSGYYTYALTGTTPPGVTFYNAAALLYGYPTTNGTFNFTITATDSSNCTGSKSYSITIGAGFARAVVNDFDGDGKSDLVVWRGKQSQWEIAGSADGKQQIVQLSEAFDPTSDVMACGDYDGDGKYDLAFYHRATSHWLIRSSKDGAALTKQWGIAGDVPVVADYDGDGKADLAVWRESESAWYIRRSSDGQTQTELFGASGLLFRDVPVPADYDGDGKTDLAVFRQGIRQGGHWYIKQSSDGQVIDKAWGLSRDVPVAADYDGDGKADIAVWRGTDNNWYILLSGRSSDDVAQIVNWGISSLGDVPVMGDYDGDGKADTAVWRASSASWYVRRGDSQSLTIQARGDADGTPTVVRH